MEHKINGMWATLRQPDKMDNALELVLLNPPGSKGITYLRKSDASLIKMCLAYVVAKALYDKKVAEQLQNDHDDPPYTKKPE